jgi:hypothetical protein
MSFDQQFDSRKNTLLEERRSTVIRVSQKDQEVGVKKSSAESNEKEK